MRNKKVIVLVALLLLSVFIIYFTMKPTDVSKEIWSEGAQIAKAIDNSVKNNESTPSGISELMSGWGAENELNESEREIRQLLNFLSIASLQIDISNILGGDSDKNESYQKAYKRVEKKFGKIKLKTTRVNKKFLTKLEENEGKANEMMAEEDEKKKEEFIKDEFITTTADEVQYNMSNSLDKQFYMAGRVELCDYYNYGFTNEDKVFCGKFTPLDDSASSGWYLYFSRDSFEGIFNNLLNGSRDIRVIAEVPSTLYKSGQGNMAWVRKTTSY